MGALFNRIKKLLQIRFCLGMFELWIMFYYLVFHELTHQSPGHLTSTSFLFLG